MWLSAEAKQPHFSCGSLDHPPPYCPLKSSVAAPGLRCPVCNHIGHTARDYSLLSRKSMSYHINQPHVTRPATEGDNVCPVYNKRMFCFRGTNFPYVHVWSACGGEGGGTHDMPSRSRHNNIHTQSTYTRL